MTPLRAAIEQLSAPGRASFRIYMCPLEYRPGAVPTYSAIARLRLQRYGGRPHSLRGFQGRFVVDGKHAENAGRERHLAALNTR
jgi:hypothetical protein